jgi:hypothetical protein
MAQKKDWDKIVSELSSGEESDAEDTPNIASVRKNGAKLMHLMAQLVNESQVPDDLKGAQQKALESGKGTIPRLSVEEFKSVGAEVGKFFASSLPKPPGEVPAKDPSCDAPSSGPPIES